MIYLNREEIPRYILVNPSDWDREIHSKVIAAIYLLSSPIRKVYCTAAHASTCRWLCCLCGADRISYQFGQVPRRLLLPCSPVQAKMNLIERTISSDQFASHQFLKQAGCYVQGCLRLSFCTRHSFLKSKILRSGSLRFSDIVNPPVRFGAVICRTVWFGPVPRWTLFSTVRLHCPGKPYNTVFSPRFTVCLLYTSPSPRD